MKGADTVVTLDGVIYEKPADEPDAVRILEQLSGRSHSVYTGVQLIYSTCGQTSRQRFYEVTEVILYMISKNPRSYRCFGEEMHMISY